MPQTRSMLARAAPKPHRLPSDILTRIAAYTRDDDLARLALSAKSALTALDNQQIWAASLRTNHGGLRIRAEPDGLRAAARLAQARAQKGPVYGCHALASDAGSSHFTSLGQPRAVDSYWVDAMFQPEPWRVHYSTMGSERILCAATFLTGGVYDLDRQWMIDALRERVDAFDLQRDYSQWSRVCPDTLAAIFYREFGGDGGGVSPIDDEVERINRKCAELEGRFDSGESQVRSGLAATVFAERGGVTFDTRIEALCGGARQATVVATSLVVRGPSGYASRPGRIFLLFGCRRPPRVSDVADGRLKQLSIDATPWCRALVNSSPYAPYGLLARHRSMLALGCTGARSLHRRSDKQTPAYQLFGSDEDIFPMAVCGFWRRLDPDDMNIRAKLRRPKAIQGIIVAILEVENTDPEGGEVNVDMEYAGVEGYTYT